ncbi:hypothetical protein GCM10020331_082070 [Ectobacillus funiculus]
MMFGKNEYSTMNVQPLKKSRVVHPVEKERFIRTYSRKTRRKQRFYAVGTQSKFVCRFSGEIRTEEYAKLLENKVEQLFVNPYLLSFTADDKRLVLFRDGRVLVHGTKHVAEAKSLYHRYFG